MILRPHWMQHYQLNLTACDSGTNNQHGSSELKKLYNPSLKRSKKGRTCLISFRENSRLAKMRGSSLLNRSVSLLTRFRPFPQKKTFKNHLLRWNPNLLLSIFPMRKSRMRKLEYLLKMALRTNILTLYLLLILPIKNLQKNIFWKMISAHRFKLLRTKTVFTRKKMAS